MRTFSITTTPNKISYGRNWKSFGPPRLLWILSNKVSSP
jgi:hypothetical protein